MSVRERLQQFQQQYQDLQAGYSQARLQKKVDPQEDNRRLLLSGADPTKRQRELQVSHLPSDSGPELTSSCCFH